MPGIVLAFLFWQSLNYFGAGWVTGTLGSGLGLLGLIDDVAFLVIRQSLEMSNWEGFELAVFLDEAGKMIEEGIITAQEDDRQRQARHAALVRWHGDRVYLYGDIDLADAALLWWSGRELMLSDIVLELVGVAGEAAEAGFVVL